MLFGAGWPDDPASHKAGRIHRGQQFDPVVRLAVTPAHPEVRLDTKTAVVVAATAAHQRHWHAIHDLVGTRAAQLRFDGRADPITEAGQHPVQLACPAIERTLAHQTREVAPPVFGRPAKELALRATRLPLRQHRQGQDLAIAQLTRSAWQVRPHRPGVLPVQVIDQAIDCHQEGVHIGIRRRLLGVTRPTGSSSCGHLPSE